MDTMQSLTDKNEFTLEYIRVLDSVDPNKYVGTNEKSLGVHLAGPKRRRLEGHATNINRG